MNEIKKCNKILIIYKFYDNNNIHSVEFDDDSFGLNLATLALNNILKVPKSGLNLVMRTGIEDVKKLDFEKILGDGVYKFSNDIDTEGLESILDITTNPINIDDTDDNLDDDIFNSELSNIEDKRNKILEIEEEDLNE
jgi:hypothetical protein